MGECLSHLLLHPGYERLCIHRLIQCVIVLFTLVRKILWDILVRVTVTVCPFDPHLLTAQSLTQSLQDAHFVMDTVDALAPFLVTLYHQRTQFVRHHRLHRYVLHINEALPASCIPFRYSKAVITGR